MFTYPSSTGAKNQLIDELLNDRDSFNELHRLYLHEEVDEIYGWALTYVIQKKPDWAIPFQADMIHKLSTTEDDAAKRNILRSMQYMEISEDYEGEVLEICYSVLRSEHEKIAARVFAMSVIYPIVKKYPELGYELETTLKDLWDYGSAGFKSRARKIILELQK